MKRTSIVSGLIVAAIFATGVLVGGKGDASLPKGYVGSIAVNVRSLAVEGLARGTIQVLDEGRVSMALNTDESLLMKVDQADPAWDGAPGEVRYTKDSAGNMTVQVFKVAVRK